MKAYIDMEERFARLTICFKDKETEKLANAKIDGLLKQYELTPDLWESKSECCEGQTIIEFEDEIDENLRPFLETVCRELNLEFEDTTVAHS